jgi:cytoskeletal protein CcmA (bactofilin family)
MLDDSPTMRPLRKTKGPSPQRAQQGNSLIVVILTVMVTGLLAGLAESSAFHSSSASTVTEKQVDATSTANAGVDRTIEAIANSPIASLPCGPLAVTGTLGTAPMASSYAASVTYYSALPPGGSTLTCAALQSGAAIPSYALVDSTGSATSPNGAAPQTARMQALLQLSTVPGGGFDDAIFANGSISFANLTTINGEPGSGSNANLYSNQSMSCANNEVVHGSVTVQGAFTATNRCSVDGTVYATGNISFSNSGTVGGDLKSSGGAISLSNSNVVDGSAIAAGTVTLYNQATVLGSVVQNAVVPPPPYQSFPAFSYQPSDWTAAGFTNQISDNDCNPGDPTNVYRDIASMAYTTTPTVIVTSCALSWSNNSSISLDASLAVISTGGFSAVNRFIVSDAASSPVDLFFLVPSSVTCSNGGTISFSNNTSISPSVDVFLYSPCNVSFANNQATTGQIYSGGNVQIANQFTMTYMPLALPSLSGLGNSVAYQPAVVYERQAPPGS